MVKMAPPAIPSVLSDCAERGFRYEPPDMMLSFRTVEPNYEACRHRCKITVYCNFFAYWPDGGCHVTGGDAHRVTAENYNVISGPKDCSGVYKTTTNFEAWKTTSDVPVPMSHTVPAGTFADEPTVVQQQNPHSYHMAEIRIPLRNLRITALSQPELHLLQARYAEALSETLDIPPDLVTEGPDPNSLKAQVSLKSESYGAVLTAFTLNDPVDSPDPSRLARQLKVPQLASNIKAATSRAALPVDAFQGAALQVGEPEVGTKEHPLRAPPAEPSFFSQWWPLLAVLAIIVCVCGGITIHSISQEDERPDKKRLRVAGRGVSQDSEMAVAFKDAEFEDDSSFGPSPRNGDSYAPDSRQGLPDPPPPYQGTASYQQAYQPSSSSYRGPSQSSQARQQGYQGFAPQQYQPRPNYGA